MAKGQTVTRRSVKIALEEIASSIEGLLWCRGFGEEEAEAIAEFSTRSTAEGHLAHGLGALWILDRLGELTRAEDMPVVSELGGCQFEIEAGDALGYLAARQAVDRLCSMPSAPAVAVIRSRGFRGRLGHLVRRLAVEGRVAMAVQITPAVVRTEKSWGAVLGTNPMAIGVPESDRNPIIADFTTASESWADWYLHRYLDDVDQEIEQEEPDLEPFGEMRGLALSIGLQAMVHAMVGEDLLVGDKWSLAIVALPVRKAIDSESTQDWAGLLNLRSLPGQRSEERFKRAQKEGVWIPEKLWRWAKGQDGKS